MVFFEHRLHKIEIIDNREWLFPGEAKILSFITGKNVNIPVMDDYMKMTDPDAKRAFLRGVINTTLATKVLMEVGANKIPEAFNWALLVLEIDEDVRSIGGIIDSITQSDEYDKFVENLFQIMQMAIDPTIVAGMAISKFIFKWIGNTIMKNKDDQIGVLYQSFNQYQHYTSPNTFKKESVVDLTRNMFVDYSIFWKK